ncbi:hypothetical protein H696_00607 [Fonticula alba]|uniref:Uncharacterized protein n=1 Tax=Fonticula alba TaxID=691883 RepID=A0A058ZGH4_FONAL|nr:hypothetical protein H696_00607 [Fonticula alba]KCV73061.1 hypothetical protein H696_00607 [Fonticula alba]|eukprot:XP_009492762.1 hypothetical protein H696_00607 [Fonticula alba]
MLPVMGVAPPLPPDPRSRWHADLIEAFRAAVARDFDRSLERLAHLPWIGPGFVMDPGKCPSSEDFWCSVDLLSFVAVDIQARAHVAAGSALGTTLRRVVSSISALSSNDVPSAGFPFFRSAALRLLRAAFLRSTGLSVAAGIYQHHAPRLLHEPEWHECMLRGLEHGADSGMSPPEGQPLAALIQAVVYASVCGLRQQVPLAGAAPGEALRAAVASFLDFRAHFLRVQRLLRWASDARVGAWPRQEFDCAYFFCLAMWRLAAASMLSVALACDGASGMLSAADAGRLLARLYGEPVLASTPVASARFAASEAEQMQCDGMSVDADRLAGDLRAEVYAAHTLLRLACRAPSAGTDASLVRVAWMRILWARAIGQTMEPAAGLEAGKWPATGPAAGGPLGADLVLFGLQGSPSGLGLAGPDARLLGEISRRLADRRTTAATRAQLAGNHGHQASSLAQRVAAGLLQVSWRPESKHEDLWRAGNWEALVADLAPAAAADTGSRGTGLALLSGATPAGVSAKGRAPVAGQTDRSPDGPPISADTGAGIHGSDLALALAGEVVRQVADFPAGPMSHLGFALGDLTEDILFPGAGPPEPANGRATAPPAGGGGTAASPFDPMRLLRVSLGRE